MRGNLVEAHQEPVDEGGLGNGDGSGSSVTGDGNAKGKIGWAEISDVPVRLEFSLESGVFVYRRCGAENVINVDGEDYGPSGGLTHIYTPLAGESLKAKGFNDFVKCLVPDASSLFHSIDAFHEFHYPVLLAGRGEARGLLHIHSFLFW